MFGFFRKKQSEVSETGNNLPGKKAWIAELNETQERWFVFLDKMEAKMEELCTAAIPELKEVLASDEDPYKRTFLKVQSGVNGQLENIRKKVYDTYDEKINDTYNYFSSQVSVLQPEYATLNHFRTACSDRYHKIFDEKYQHWSEEIRNTAKRDLEVEYRKILAEFEAVKDQFNCKKCGSQLTIEKIFFISTYISCPYCQTQNTFEPGTQARNLQFLSRDLAEQRTAPLYAAYEREKERERELYHQNHELKLSTIHEKDRKVLAQKQAEMEDLEKQRQQAIKNAPVLYQEYLRAMYDEWNRITPDLKEHNEKMYQNQLANHINH